MTGDQPTFDDLITDAHRCIAALDEFGTRDGGKAAAAVKNGKRMYTRLLDYRGTVRMSEEENCLLKTTLDVLRARLRFFGESV
jgi:hypothetical protein